MIRKLALQIGFPALLVFVAWNAYLTLEHFYRLQKTSTLMLESSLIQANLAVIVKDLTDMETGERGYVVTDDPSYLQPYTDAKERIGTDFAALRSGLAARPQEEQSLEAQLESLAHSKQAEMEHAIQLRRNGYRLRSFRLMATNEGKQYMDEIRRVANSLSAAENGDFANLERERTSTFNRAQRVILISNCVLLIVTACLFGLMRQYVRLLGKQSAHSRGQLALRDAQLQRLTFVLAGEARSNIAAINSLSELLLEQYADFLPRQGAEYTEQIRDAAGEIERIRQELLGGPESANREKAA